MFMHEHGLGGGVIQVSHTISGRTKYAQASFQTVLPRIQHSSSQPHVSPRGREEPLLRLGWVGGST